jgi:hypothetical protein
MTPIDAEIAELDLVVYAKDQPQYIPLPARVDSEGTVVTCWQLTWRERWKMFLSGKFYLTLLTFGKPLQPIRCSTEKPGTERTH